jgi:hypothetical protein
VRGSTSFLPHFARSPSTQSLRKHRGEKHMFISSLSISGDRKMPPDRDFSAGPVSQIYTCARSRLISTSSESITINVDKVSTYAQTSRNPPRTPDTATRQTAWRQCSPFYKVSSSRSLSAVQSLRRTTHALLRANASCSRPSKDR